MIIKTFETVLLFTALVVLACPSLAEIRHTQIQSKDPTLFFIDAFGFGHIGGLQLNLSQINLLQNPNPNLNLTLVGFFTVSRGDSIRANITYKGFEAGVCYLQSQFINILYTFDNLEEEGNKSVDLEFSIKGPDGLQLCFQNCVPHLQVTVHTQSAMYNLDRHQRRNYLSYGMNWLLGYLFVFMLVYLLLAAVWIRALRQKTSNRIFGIHWVILFFVILKILSFFLELLNFYYIWDTGHAKNFLLVFTSTSGLFTGLDLFVVAGLIGSGWSFMKSKILLWEKILQFIVCSALAVCNAVIVYNNINYPTDITRQTFHLCHRFVYIFGFFALLYPILFNTRHLLRAAEAQGKAALSFRKVKRLRQLFFLLFFYLTVVNIVPFVLEIYLLGTRFFWISFKGIDEPVKFVLYIFIGYNWFPGTMMRPLCMNDDEERSALEALKLERFHFDVMDKVTFSNKEALV